MGFTFETLGSITYLVYRIERGETTDATGLGMLTNNKIPGLAPLYYTQSDSEVFLRYAVTSKISVKDFFAGEINRRKLAGVLSGIAASAVAAEEYLIDSSMLVFEPEYIFLDVTTLQASLVCLPVTDRMANSPTPREFFKELIVNARYDEEEDCGYVAGVINCLNGGAPFTLSGLDGVLSWLERGDVRNAAPEARGRDGELREREDGRYATPVTSAVPPPPERVSAPVRAAAAEEEDTGETSGKGRERRAEQTPPGGERGGALSAASGADNADETVSISLPYLLTHYSRKNKLLYSRGRKRGDKRSAAASGEREGFAIPGEVPPPIDGSGAASAALFPPPQKDKRGAKRARKRGGRGGERGTGRDSDGQSAAESPRSPPQTARRDLDAAAAPGGEPAGETAVLGGPDAAVVAADGAVAAGAPYLIRVRSDERIAIDMPLFRIGKERGFADYCIADNAAISRSHAYIVTRGGQCLLKDTNSANHTYLGGEIITCGREYALAHGARFRLADEEFEFRLR
ncbi:MAG: DUF6382 domain-containing protein [Oscillospiraceae bacterium]|jgi:pSer/pThr/pTyr-binding forkhead associated (FHA) protein|nr:DUF6382 domain-containing protein [Oscillospiraceae bacterium]